MLDALIRGDNATYSQSHDAMLDTITISYNQDTVMLDALDRGDNAAYSQSHDAMLDTIIISYNLDTNKKK